MSRAIFAIGLDIGSGSIKGICASKKKDSENFEVLAKSEITSFGVRKGVVENPEVVSEKVQTIVKELQQATGHKIEDACININGSRIFTKASRGTVAISRADDLISEEDVDRVVQAAEAISLTSNNEMLKVFPLDYAVDNEFGIKDPVGMKGTRLEADILAVCAFGPHKRYLTNAVLDADLQVLDILPSPVAAAYAVLAPEQMELGTAVIDIGASTTGLAVYEEGKLVHTAIFPIGSNNITNDIAICLQIPVEVAERIKRDFKVRAPSKTTVKKTKSRIKTGEEVPVVEDITLNFNHKELNKIIFSRMEEILTIVEAELKKIGRQGKLPGGVVLVGGGSKLSGVLDLAKRKIKLPCQIGYPRNFSGLDPDPGLSVLCGLAAGYAQCEEEGGAAMPSIGSWFKKLLKYFIP